MPSVPLTGVAVRGGREPVHGGLVAPPSVHHVAGVRLVVAAGLVVLDEPADVHDDVLPAIDCEMFGHIVGVGLDLGLDDRRPVAVPTVPAHGRREGPVPEIPVGDLRHLFRATAACAEKRCGEKETEDSFHIRKRCLVASIGREHSTPWEHPSLRKWRGGPAGSGPAGPGPSPRRRCRRRASPGAYCSRPGRRGRGIR